jgi:hypothetical protein
VTGQGNGHFDAITQKVWHYFWDYVQFWLTQTGYPSHPRIFVHSLFLKLSSVVQKTPGFKTPSIAYFVTFLLRAEISFFPLS